MTPDTRGRLAALLGTDLERVASASGGSIAAAHRVETADGRALFVKDYGDAPPAVVRCEADGLAWLAEPDVIDVARVVAVDDAAPLLVLEWIEPGRPAADHAERLGRGLAALHASGAPGFGLDEDNFIGPLPQSNTPADTWAAFYRDSRLRPLLRQARDRGLLDASVVRDADAVLARLETLVGPEEPPARLHGDLWSGNVVTSREGAPVLVDPSIHGGHREMDLAMMRLFGGFPRRAFDAYAERAPLAPGAEERVALCQLYPLLVHVLLFGGGYVGELAAALRRYA
jgi:fructosamine-3-kinase